MSEYPAPPPMHHRFITAEIQDLSSAGQKFVNPGFRGRLFMVSSTVNGDPGADTDITVKIGGTSVGTFTIANGSSAGDVDKLSERIRALFEKDEPIEIETDGGATSAVEGLFTLEVAPT